MFDIETDWNRPAHTGKSSQPRVLRLRISSRAGESKNQGVPLRIVVALDTSGSMKGDKLARAKRACEMVARLLRDQDKFWLAAFSTQVEPLLEGIAGTASKSSTPRIEGLQATGITRTDLALEWMESNFQAERGVVWIGVLITDGHSTDSKGKALQDVTGLVQQSQQLGQKGMSVCTVGFGDADNFNTSLLQSICDQSQGWFVYADTPEKIEPQLQERFVASQAMAAEVAQLSVKPLLPGVRLDGCCRIRPEYVPLQSSTDTIKIGTLRIDTPTDFLLRMHIPPLPSGAQFGLQDVLQLEVTGSGIDASVVANASILYTDSFSQSQQVSTEVDQDRLFWDINSYSDELSQTNDSVRTGELLSNIEHTARKANLADVANQAANTLNDLNKQGKVSRRATTGLLADLRKTGDLS